MHGFQIAGGSVPGWEHTQPGKPAWHNNQDAYHWRSGEDHLVAVVCDGCSSAPQSELGALLVARLITTVLTQHLSGSFKLSKENAGELLSSLKAELLAVLGSLERVAAMAGVDSLLAESFLHTILGVVMTKEVTLIFSLGDGVWAINGEVSVIPRYEANKPPYLAYHLIPSTLDARDLEFVVLHVLPTCDLESLVIGSDGVADLASAAELPLPLLGTPLGPLSQFWKEARYVDNPDAIRRRLAMANREWVDQERHIRHGLLPDDTTLVVVRRTPCKET